MTNPIGFSFGNQSISGNVPQKPIFGGSIGSLISSGGSFPPSTPAGGPPLGLFGKDGPVVTGSTFTIPQSHTGYTPPVGTQFMGSFGSGSGFSSFGGSQALSSGSSFFTTGLQGFGSAQVNGSGTTAGSVPSISGNNTAGPSAAGFIPPVSAPLNTNNTPPSDIRNMFNAAFKPKNAAPSTGLFGAPPTNTGSIFTTPQKTGGSNDPSVFTAGNNAPMAPPMTSIFGTSDQPIFAQVSSSTTVQPASSAVNPPATGFLRAAVTPATSSTTQNISPSTASRPATGPTVFSPPPAPTTGIFSSVMPAATPTGSIFPSAQTQSNVPPASIFTTVAPALPSTASSVTPLFASTAIPTNSTFTSTAPSNSFSFPTTSSIFESVPQAQIDMISPFSGERPPLQKPNRLSYNTSLEGIINHWTSDLESYKSNFIERGIEINKCDTILFEHFGKVNDLVIDVAEVEKKECIINRMLDQLGNDQEHLDKLFDYYEASLNDIEKERSETQPIDEEREKVLQTVVTLNDKLSAMAIGAGEMIKELNDASAKVENTANIENPAGKINDARMKLKVRQPDAEGDKDMRRYHDEHTKTLSM